MVCVFVAENPIEAEFVRGYLQAAGMYAEARGQLLFQLRGGVPLSEDTLPSVWVHDVDEPEARRLLAAADARGRLRAVPSPEDSRGERGDDQPRTERLRQ